MNVHTSTDELGGPFATEGEWAEWVKDYYRED